ncbi:MAG TPA: DUF3185 family protein [Opitutaceae bacterium]|jgi:hypothetical protein|nr:DUF3185 family protein [Opitutaceae bacterium]
MKKLIALVAAAAGVWLLYMGYQRQESLAGKADKTVTTIGNKIDGGTRISTEAQYYAAGAVLTIGGVVGLGIIRR